MFKSLSVLKLLVIAWRVIHMDGKHEVTVAVTPGHMQSHSATDDQVAAKVPSHLEKVGGALWVRRASGEWSWKSEWGDW